MQTWGLGNDISPINSLIDAEEKGGQELSKFLNNTYHLTSPKTRPRLDSDAQFKLRDLGLVAILSKQGMT